MLDVHKQISHHEFKDMPGKGNNETNKWLEHGYNSIQQRKNQQKENPTPL